MTTKEQRLLKILYPLLGAFAIGFLLVRVFNITFIAIPLIVVIITALVVLVKLLYLSYKE